MLDSLGNEGVFQSSLLISLISSISRLEFEFLIDETLIDGNSWNVFWPIVIGVDARFLEILISSLPLLNILVHFSVTENVVGRFLNAFSGSLQFSGSRSGPGVFLVCAHTLFPCSARMGMSCLEGVSFSSLCTGTVFGT